MKKYHISPMRPLLSILIVFLLITGCFEDRDDNITPVTTTLEIKDFVWKAMNVFYLYKDEIPDLANDRFSSDQEYRNYLEGFSTPEDLFENLLYLPETVDRFSVIVDDYIALEQSSDGIFRTNGLEYLYGRSPGTSDGILAIISLVLNDSNADDAGLLRGQIIYAVDGVELTESNAISLLFQDTATLEFAEYDNNATPEDSSDDSIIPTGESVTLSRVQYTENPVHTVKVLDVGTQKIGYILYNRFNNEFEADLNNAFSLFQSNNIQNLVVDLRYNPGGRISTSSNLASMITGQFQGDVYSQLIYNNDLSDLNTNVLFGQTIQGGAPINSLNLSKVYVLTTNRSASASELLINSLDQYIDVVQVGDNTVGKTQASLPLYDSPDFTRSDLNPNHTYAIQPLIANSVNKNGVGVPGTGLVPDIAITEGFTRLGVLGDPEERLLAAAIADITGGGRVRYDQEDFIIPVESLNKLNNKESDLLIDPLTIDRIDFLKIE